MHIGGPRLFTFLVRARAGGGNTSDFVSIGGNSGTGLGMARFWLYSEIETAKPMRAKAPGRRPRKSTTMGDAGTRTDEAGSVGRARDARCSPGSSAWGNGGGLGRLGV